MHAHARSALALRGVLLTWPREGRRAGTGGRVIRAIIRLSTHVYNTKEEEDESLAALNSYLSFLFFLAAARSTASWARN
jgi:hypothetical protein